MSYQFGYLGNLFYDDFSWSRWKTNYSAIPRVITWSYESRQLLFRGIYSKSSTKIHNYINAIQHGFNLWDRALDSISFKKTTHGNNADITFGTSSETYGNYAYFALKTTESRAIESGRVRLNDNMLRQASPLLQQKIIIHEIGNLLGLGDIKCSPRIRSVQEDQCRPVEPFIGGSYLYAYDTNLIKHYYGEQQRTLANSSKWSSALNSSLNTQSTFLPNTTDSTSKNIDQNSDKEYLPSTINGTNLNDKISGKSSDDTINGFLGSDTIKAKQGDDLVYGSEGDDKIWGGSGDDIIHPGPSGQKRDKITSGLGSDLIVLHRDGSVLITDFQKPYDRIDTSAINGVNITHGMRKTYVIGEDERVYATIIGKIMLTETAGFYA